MGRAVMPDGIGISVSYPLPGTKFYERVKSELGDKTNWRDSDDLAMLYHGPFSTEFYRQLHTVIHKEYRARKTWRRLIKLQVRPWHLTDLRQIGSMVNHTFTLPSARAKLDALGQVPQTSLISL